MCKLLIAAVLSFVFTPVLAVDLFTSKLEAHEKQSEKYKAKEVLAPTQGGFGERFVFKDKDPVVGGLSLIQAPGAQMAKLNIVNYNLVLGSNRIYPFQIFVTPTTNGTGNQVNEASANQAKILDPESGTAITFPFIWSYKAPTGICGFGTTYPDGRCDLGGSFTVNAKDLKSLSGTTSTAYGAALNFGVSGLFPIFDQTSALKAGYLATAFKLAYIYSNADSSQQLFTPVLDANGNPIQFTKSLGLYEVDIKFAISNQFALTWKLVGPLEANAYLKKQASLSLDTQFQ